MAGTARFLKVHRRKGSGEAFSNLGHSTTESPWRYRDDAAKYLERL